MILSPEQLRQRIDLLDLEAERRKREAWKPREYQKPLWDALNGGIRRAIAVWHRRAGKDDVALAWARKSMEQRPGNYWHMLPEQTQARKAIWTAINSHSGRRRIDEHFPLDWKRREQEMSVTAPNGATWQVVGSDNYDSLVGSPPVGVVYSEWALADPRSWAYIRPILLENDGWAVFIYTPRGRNHAYSFFEGAQSDDTWFSQRLTVDDTGIFAAESLKRERDELRREYGPEAGDAQFRQEYYCDFNAPLLGAIYGPQMAAVEDEGRIRSVPFERGIPVETWWDLGRSDDTAIWFVQRVAGELHFLRYHANRQVDLDHYAAVLQDFEREHRDMIWGPHIWPHDGGHKRLGQNNRSLEEQFYKLGWSVEVQPRPDDVWPGINRVRQILPRCYFDKDGCEEGIEALRMYQLREDDKRSGALRKYYQRVPLHNWASNGADAFRTGAMAEAGPLHFFDKPIRPRVSIV